MLQNIFLIAFAFGSRNSFAEPLDVKFRFKPVCLMATMPNAKEPSFMIRTIITYKEESNPKKLFIDIGCGDAGCNGVAIDISKPQLNSGGAVVMANLRRDRNTIRWVLGSFDIDSVKNKVIYKYTDL